MSVCRWCRNGGGKRFTPNSAPADKVSRASLFCDTVRMNQEHHTYPPAAARLPWLILIEL